MAKVRPVRPGRAKPKSDARVVVPCAILLIAGIALLGVLFYYLLVAGANK